MVGGVACPSSAPTVSGRFVRLDLRFSALFAGEYFLATICATGRDIYDAVVPTMGDSRRFFPANGTFVPMDVVI